MNKEDLTRLTSARLREALNDNNMKAQELADRSGVSKSSISQYVNGSHSPSNVASYKMGKILGVKPEWLMGLNDVKTDIPDMPSGTGELLDLYSRATPEQRSAVLNLLRSFVAD